MTDPKTHGEATAPWVVVPTYNEKSNITRLVEKLFEASAGSMSVLVVDDNSPDGTADAVKQLQHKYPRLHIKIRPRKQGLGRAYRDGFAHALQAGASQIVQMDADFSHDPADVPRLLASLKQHDVVIGSRYSNGISVINWPLRRLLLSTAANVYAGLITGMPFKDTTGGFRAWRSSVLREVDLTQINVDGYGFQIAMLHKAWKKKLRIVEIPIIFTERREGQSKMSRAIVLEAIWLVWKLRLVG